MKKRVYRACSLSNTKSVIDRVRRSCDEVVYGRTIMESEYNLREVKETLLEKGYQIENIKRGSFTVLLKEEN